MGFRITSQSNRRFGRESHRRWRKLAIAVGAITLVITSCSSDGDGSTVSDSPQDETSSTATHADTEQSDMATEDAARPLSLSTVETISQPDSPSSGIHYPQPAPQLPDTYVEEEFFLAGSATQFNAVETPRTGEWVVEPSGDAPYQTRAIVRRPADPTAFSGTVLVEWFNVSAIEAAPDWGFLHEAITRDGHAYVGVSVQAQGVIGGAPILGVDVDDEAAADQGVATGTGGLTSIDPSRYGSLSHPGDAFAFDMYNQALKAARDENDILLGGLIPDHVIAMGESQSAMFLTTFINSIHPLDPVADGYLVHSRGSMVPTIDGKYVSNRDSEAAARSESNDVLIREDLDVPVFLVAAETDLTILGYAQARQDDNELIRTWEIAGTAHADAETLRAVIGGPRDPMVGDILGCGPINTGPHKEVLRAALHHLITWVAEGVAPPTAERIELEDAGSADGIRQAVIARDEHGNARGGIRTPMLDLPAATLTGEPASVGGLEELTDSGDVCLLFGQTLRFTSDKLVDLYGDFDSYIAAFTQAADATVANGFMLEPDAAALISDMGTVQDQF